MPPGLPELEERKPGGAAQQSNRAVSTLIALALTFPFIPRGNATENQGHDCFHSWDGGIAY